MGQIAMLTVWGRKTSSNVQAVMWCLTELGLAVERIDAGHTFGGTDTPAYRAMNPTGKIPVLRDGDGPPLWESGAILRYLAGRYGAAPFWPSDIEARARVDVWAEWAKINVSAGFTVPIFWRLVRTPARDRDMAAVRRSVDALVATLRIAEDRLSGHPYLAGDDFTLADIQLGHLLYRYYDIAIARPPYPALRRYYDTLTERPAYRDHVMVPYDDLRVD